MRRDLSRLASTAHDLLVIGGGIQGACIAWDATQRGLAVALVERDDFGSATSANSLRIVHGGIRYLARGDLPRMRESIRERSALLRIAPGLVEPLPVLVPTGPPGVPGRAAFGAALALTHALSLTRNRHLDPSRHIAAGRILSRAETLRPLPRPGSRVHHRRRTLVRRADGASGAAHSRLRRVGGGGRCPGGQSRRGGGLRAGRRLGGRGGGSRRRRPRSADRRAIRHPGPPGGDRGRSMDGDARRCRPAGLRDSAADRAARLCHEPRPRSAGRRRGGGSPVRRLDGGRSGRLGRPVPLPRAAGAYAPCSAPGTGWPTRARTPRPCSIAVPKRFLAEFNRTCPGLGAHRDRHRRPPVGPAAAQGGTGARLRRRRWRSVRASAGRERVGRGTC